MASLTGAPEEHRDILESLPDYAIGALSDDELDAVALHLESCPACRQELRLILQTVAVISPQPTVSAAARETVLSRAQAARPATPPPTFETSAIASDAPSIPLATKRPLPWRTRPIGWGALGLAAAAAILVVAFGISALRTAAPSDETAIAAIVADSPFSLLMDSQLTPPATGVLFGHDDATRAVLLAQGLPALPDDRRYQIWLFTDDGERTSGGGFNVGPDGRAEVLIDTPQPLLAYAAVAVSAEPAAGSQEPTSPLALGGWLD